jgi:ABC-type multidrug transport system ATPase subunit
MLIGPFLICHSRLTLNTDLMIVFCPISFLLGMDPTNRRHVWTFIEKFKQGRIIILTTHSMEEADILGDRICVMAHGRLRAIGSSIHLKNKFGAGYRISLVTDPANAEHVKSIIESKVPDCILKDDSAGALLYQFPPTSMSSIPRLVEWLEGVDGGSKSTRDTTPQNRSAQGSNTNSGQNTPLQITSGTNNLSPTAGGVAKGLAAKANLGTKASLDNEGDAQTLIHGYGISQTSLEEVFLKLIRDANPEGYQGYEVAKKGAEDKKPQPDSTLRNRGAGR